MPEAVLTPDLVAFVREQADRQAILDCLHRYTRGLDRLDRELMLSAYHADAWDDHGLAEGPAADFVDWAIDFHGQHGSMHHHMISNHSVEIDGDTAHSETYYTFMGENREGPPSLGCGRYIDRFEKRDGKWAIAHRVSVNEMIGTFNEAVLPEEWKTKLLSTGPNRRDREDISYRRPLVRAGD